MARAILGGTYVYPPDTDPVTRLLLEEAAIAYASMPKEMIATYLCGGCSEEHTKDISIEWRGIQRMNP